MELVAQAQPHSGLSSLVFLVALMVVIGFLLLRSHRYFSRQDRSWTPSTRPPTARSQRPLHAAAPPEEVVQWEVRMHDLARELSGRLDSKMVALGHLIRDADRAAARLETALEAAARSDATGGDQTASRDVPPVAKVAGPQEPPPSQAEALKAASAPESPARSSGDRRYEEIYLLADYGFEPLEIAHRAGMPVGEIELILSLRAKR